MSFGSFRKLDVLEIPIGDTGTLMIRVTRRESSPNTTWALAFSKAYPMALPEFVGNSMLVSGHSVDMDDAVIQAKTLLRKHRDGIRQRLDTLIGILGDSQCDIEEETP